MPNVIHVLIVDDDPEWREALQEYLSYDGEISVIGEASNREEAIAWAESGHVFDIVLMDINLSGALFDGIDVMLDISERVTCKFIMLTSLQNNEIVQAAFSSGAINYITKEYVEAIPQAIKDAYADKASIHHSVSGFIRGDWVRLSNHITDREVEILKYLENGYSFRQISEELIMENQSVKNYAGRVAKKLGYSRFNRSIIKQAKQWRWFQ
ncbi:Transcriptional regulatory protein DevR (DosR) [compost metagenome]